MSTPRTMLRRSLILNLSCAPHRPASERSDWCVGWCWGLFALILLGTLSAQYLREQRAEAQSGEPEFIQTAHSKIPNFCKSPTIAAVSSGNWSSPGTWSLGRVPGTSDIVMIPAGVTVRYDAASGVADCLGIHGKVVFKTDAQTKLTVGTAMVYADGALEVGTEGSPVSANVTAEIVIADKALDTTDDGNGVFDPSQYGTGILGFGKVQMFGAAKNPTFVRLKKDMKKGDTTLELQESVSGWRTGDRLLLPGTSATSQREELVVASVNGSIITLAGPLVSDHKGPRDGDGITPTVLKDGTALMPWVANLTRNITFRSENPAGTRGHFLVTQRTNTDIRYVDFRDLGRTTIDHLEDTLFNADGSVNRIGTNQRGRYTLHMHHVIGPVSSQTPENGYQYTLIGNSIENNGATASNKKWGITVHDSHYGLIKDNVMYNVGGSGVMTEDGSESENVFEHNFAARVMPAPDGGERADTRLAEGDLGFEGSAYWFWGPKNYVRDNVATDTFVGYTYFAQAPERRVPLFKGADTSVAGQYINVVMSTLPLLEFARNEDYATSNGLTIWYNWPTKEAPSIVKDFRVWHNGGKGFYGYPTANTILDGFVARGDVSILSNVNNNSLGLWWGDYAAIDPVLRNADIQGYRIGFSTPTFAYGKVTIEDSNFRNVYNIDAYTISAPGSFNNGRGMPAKHIEITRSKFAQLPGDIGQGFGVVQKNIRMLHTPQVFYAPNVVAPNTVFVYDYDQIPGNNFQVFFVQQAPDSIVPKTENALMGSPEAGLTNQQNWDKYALFFDPNAVFNSRKGIWVAVPRTERPDIVPGVAIAGAVAPCQNSTAHPEILGFICPLNTPPPPRSPSLSITAPKNNETIIGATVTGSYIGSAGDDAMVDHLHLQLDSDPEVRGLSLIGSSIFANVPIGNHILKGYLAHADHSKVPGTDTSVIFTTTTSPQAEELCLSPRPENRIRLATQDFSNLATTLTITDPQGLIVYSAVQTPTSKEGEIRITDPAILAKISDTTTYTLTVHPESHRRRKMTLLGSDLKQAPCDPFPGSPFGFLDESGGITIQHLVRLIAHYRTQADAQVNRAFLNQRFTLRDLISVIRLYVSNVRHE